MGSNAVENDLIKARDANVATATSTENAPAGGTSSASERASQLAPLLQLRDATVVRAGRPILSIDQLVLEQGERIAILGPNGSGKSTFVKLITREMLPLYRDEPPVMFKGSPRAVLADVKKSLGIVSSSMQDQITVHLSAAEVVEGGLFGSLGIPKHVNASPQSREKALESMRMLGVEGLADQDIMTLSTGQARRVLFARALVHDPDTLILDEPCTGLDPEGMYYVRSSMRDLARAGKGIVLVTHYPEDIIPEIDRLVLIKNGHLFDDGSKETLLTSETMSRLFDVPLSVERRCASELDCASARVVENGSSQPHHGISPTDDYFSLVSAY